MTKQFHVFVGIEMIEQEKAQFKAMMKALTQLFGKQELDTELLRIWWHKLSRFDFGVVSKSIDKYVDNNKRMPTPADILELCKGQEERVFNTALPKPKHTEEQIKQNQERLAIETAKLKKTKSHRQWAHDILRLHGQGQYNFDLGIKYAKEVVGE